MEEEFVKEKKIKERTKEDSDKDLIKTIIKTKKELEVAGKNFEYAEGDLIDYYSYQIKANKAKLDYLLKKAKNKKLALNMLSEISITLNLEEAM